MTPLAPFEIRPATQADAGAIRSLIHRVKINPLSLDWRRFVLAVNPAGEILGCGQIKPHGDGTRELASIAVWPRYQGGGVGRALVAHLLASSNPPLYLTCRASLRRFYEPFGFHPLEPEEMPPYFRRIWTFVRVARAIFRGAQPMLVMRFEAKRPELLLAYRKEVETAVEQATRAISAQIFEPKGV